MAHSSEDQIIKLKIQLQNLEREREALSARIAAKRAELYEAKKAQQAGAAALSQSSPSPAPRIGAARKTAPSLPSSSSAAISRRSSQRHTASSRARMSAPSQPANQQQGPQ